MKSSVPLHWRLNSQRYRMVGSGCTACERVAFPPRERCPFCVENSINLSFEQAMTATREAFVTDLSRLVLEKQVA